MVLSFAGCSSKASLEKELAEAAKEINKATSEALNNTTSKATVSSATTSTKELNPFESVTLSFEGMSPNATAKISGGNSNVSYQVTPEGNLKNGDKVTVTATLKASAANSYTLTETTKEFTVEGVAGYAAKLDEISDDAKSKMEKQAEDMITALAANSYSDGAKLKNKELLGYYFLTSKEGFNSQTQNSAYLVYKITTNITYLTKENTSYSEHNKNVPSYIYCKFDNITTTPDGTSTVNLANGNICNNTFETDYSKTSSKKWNLYGFADIDTLFNEVIAKNVANYNYENTVEEKTTTSSTPNTSSSTSSASTTSSSTSSN